jgi:hypothetical protein
MARTASPLTAIGRMRKELDRLEGLIRSRAERTAKGVMRVVRRRRPAKRAQQVCGKCGKPGHNARGHRNAMKRR